MGLFGGSILTRGQSSRIQMDGTLHPDFIPVAEALRHQLETSPGGAAVCVYHRGQSVLDLWGGVKDHKGSPWDHDTMAPSFSTTKGVASTLLHMMVDRGLVRYDDRVAEYWPGFAQAGKERITIRHVLAHQSGLYHIRQMIDRADRMLDWPYMVRAIERAAPLHAPGARSGYHGLTYGYLVGEILQRVTGRSFSRLVQDEIAKPLQLDGMHVGAPPAVLPRAAELLWPKPGLLQRWVPPTPELGDRIEKTAALIQQALLLVGLDIEVGSLLDALVPRGISSFDFGARQVLRAAIPSANGLFTARSLARMYAALANGGELNGVRLLSTDAVKRATQLQGRAPRLAVLPFDMRWRLGYHAIFTTRGIPRAAFGHFGFGGSGAWADPSRELAVAMIVNSGMGTPFGDLRIARISGAALLSVDRRRQRQRARSAFEPRRFRSPLSEVVGLARPAGKRAGTPPGRVSAAGARA
ncbi:MAG: serine hydrolase [Deltaproteobacteria bacterium]|nr:serine hydrolase [Deltaproteobacteria bacterium]